MSKEILEDKIDKLVEIIKQVDKKNDDRFNDLEKTIDSLAIITKNGFDLVGQRFEQVDKKLDEVDKKLTLLDRGQEDIKLRLDNVAYRFELTELQRRVILLEKKAGFAK